tara:strand:+ start:128 stop:337 length:210 start_codon:yes stop_codon:yes gene_type:complete
MNTPTKRKTAPCQVKANQKYRDANRARYNEYQRNYLKKKYDEDPEYREKIRTKQLAYCKRKRAEKLETE